MQIAEILGSADALVDFGRLRLTYRKLGLLTNVPSNCK